MTSISLEELKDIMESAIKDKLCIRSWLGNADVLFLGFGSQVLPPPIRINGPGNRPLFIHPATPPYEVQAVMSDWRIDKDSMLLGSSYDDPRAEAAAATLVGKYVMGWRFLEPGWGLCIDFEDGFVFQILPYDNVLDEPAWILFGIDFYYRVYRTGRIDRRQIRKQTYGKQHL